MDYTIAPMFPFKVIGFQRVFYTETSYQKIPEFWDEICEKYAKNVYAGNAPAIRITNCAGTPRSSGTTA